jgi:translation initiation factor IF-2
LPIRIYALAKELKIENKALVDICNQIGITGKGSALASLTDEEAANVKAHLEKQKPTRAASHVAAAAGSVADRVVGQTGGAVVRREDYIAPAGTPSRKVPSLDKKPEKPSHARKPGQEEDAAKTAEKVDREKPEKTGPVIKMAPIPAAQTPAAAEKPAEPAPQKPDMKLPLEAIRASRVGSKPLSEHLRRHEEKRRAELAQQASAKKEEKGGRAKERDKGVVGPVEPGGKPSRAARDKETPVKEKDRGRRGVRTTAAPEGTEEEASKVTLGGREHRQLKRKRTPPVPRVGVGGAVVVPEEEETPTRVVPRGLRRQRRSSGPAPIQRKTHATVELPCTVRSLSEMLGVPAQQVMAKLLELGVPSIITANVEREMAELVAVGLGVTNVVFREPVSLEKKLLTELDLADLPELLKPRPPVVTFLGHVDHGKTSLLDKILGMDVAAHEKGGITQHIRAYRVEKEGRAIAFVDTPGHEAFTAMRARGANSTDIAVLVVAADDGVMPQTEEAISHARAAGVPIVVALNKIDLPGVNVDRVLQELAANELLPAEWGGDTEIVRTSATTGQGVDDLLDTLLTVAELHEYKANPDRAAMGVCLESEVQTGRGVVAKVLVQNGTLRVGDVVVCGPAHGRVKAMYDTLNPYKKYKEAGPSTPVNLTGLDAAPAAGDHFHVLGDISQARQIAQDRAAVTRQQELSGAITHVTLENLFERLGARDEVQTLNIILRADVRGSIEAIIKELGKLQHPEVQIKVLQRTVGGVTEADVHLAHASDAVIIGFNVVADEKARVLADQLGVQIRRYDIIYQVTDDLRAALEGMLKPEKRETELGRVLVQRVFHISRVGSVAGCRVVSGVVQRDARIRLVRDNRVIGDYSLESLKREKDDAREVREGFECGIKLGGFDDIKEADMFDVYKVEEIRRTF